MIPGKKCVLNVTTSKIKSWKDAQQATANLSQSTISDSIPSIESSSGSVVYTESQEKKKKQKKLKRMLEFFDLLPPKRQKLTEDRVKKCCEISQYYLSPSY